MDKTNGGGADGMAFVVQALSPDQLGEDQGHLGYGLLKRTFAVEMDSFQNLPFQDPDNHHISLHYAAGPDLPVLANEVVGRYQSCPPFNDNKPHTLTVQYSDTTSNLTMSLDNSCTKTVRLNLTAAIDLLDGGKAYLGFTGSTGGSWQTNELVSWSHDIDGGPATCLNGAYNASNNCQVKAVPGDCSVYKNCEQCTQLAATCCGFCNNKCVSVSTTTQTCKTQFSCPVASSNNDNHQVVWWGVAIVIVVLVLCALALFVYWRRTRIRSRGSFDPTLLSDEHQASDRDAETQYSQL